MITFTLGEGEDFRDTRGLPRICAADGCPPAATDPLVIDAHGWRIHRSHFTDPASGFNGEPYTEEEDAP